MVLRHAAGSAEADADGLADAEALAEGSGVALALADASGVSWLVTVPTPGGVVAVSDDPAAAGIATATRLVASRAANAYLGRTTA
jgi:hypothetical protein